MYRDKGEVVNLKNEYINPSEANVEEIMQSLSYD
jgi:hypothetical protein